MTQQQIDKGNQIIAQFEGWVKNGKTQTYTGDIINVYRNKKGDVWRCDFDYNNSWAALMPVIEKISKHEYERYLTQNGDDEYEEIETAYPRTFGMINSRTGDFMFRFNRCYLFGAPTLIEAAWLAVVDFIQTSVKDIPKPE
jgi:hypothetical protein